MRVPIAVWQPCELPYTLVTYLVTYLLNRRPKCCVQTSHVGDSLPPLLDLLWAVAGKVTVGVVALASEREMSTPPTPHVILKGYGTLYLSPRLSDSHRDFDERS